MTIRVPYSTPENPIIINWNSQDIKSGDSVIIDNANRLILKNDNNQIIADISLDSSAQYIQMLIISNSCSDDACAKSLCGRVCKLDPNNNQIPITDMVIYPFASTSSNTRTDPEGVYNRCFPNPSYNFRYKRDASIYEIHVTVNNQNDPDLRIDVYLDDSSDPIIPPPPNPAS